MLRVVPLRSQEFREICSHPDCEGWASGACVRCAKPLCAEHVPEEDRRCHDCETRFDAEVAGLPAPVDFMRAVGVAVPVVFFIVYEVLLFTDCGGPATEQIVLGGLVAVILLMILGGVFRPKARLARKVRRMRREFLDVRADTGEEG